MLKNVNILEFCDYIWNHHEKRIEISTNMPGSGLEICEILRSFVKQNVFEWMVKPDAWPRAKYQYFVHTFLQ